MSEYPLVLVTESRAAATADATFNAPFVVQAVSDAAFTLATFAAKLAGGIVGSVAGLSVAPLSMLARGVVHRTVGSADDSADPSHQASEPMLTHEVPTPNAPMAPVAQAVRELEE